ncbi:MAG TPA: hypothetical protein VHE78_02035 [Gemmatimonadaceae bacterium]|nr:hypothetical protein [Gemmatimonadaceae bacterium]
MPHTRPSRLISLAVLTASLLAAGAALGCSGRVIDPTSQQATMGTIVAVRSVSASPALGGAPGVEVVVTSTRNFPPVNALVTLAIGDVMVRLSRYPDGTLSTLAFTLSRPEFDRTVEGAPVIVRYDPDSQGHWDFGLWRRGMLDR